MRVPSQDHKSCNMQADRSSRAERRLETTSCAWHEHGKRKPPPKRPKRFMKSCLTRRPVTRRTRSISSGYLQAEAFAASTPYQHLHGQRNKGKTVEFGEEVFYYVPKRLRSKMSLRWSLGTFMGPAHTNMKSPLEKDSHKYEASHGK